MHGVTLLGKALATFLRKGTGPLTKVKGPLMKVKGLMKEDQGPLVKINSRLTQDQGPRNGKSVLGKRTRDLGKGPRAL